MFELVEKLIHNDPIESGLLNYHQDFKKTKVIAIEENEFHQIVEINQIDEFY